MEGALTLYWTDDRLILNDSNADVKVKEKVIHIFSVDISLMIFLGQQGTLTEPGLERGAVDP